MSDHYYKAFKTWDHIVAMLFGILSRCDSMTEICEGLKAMRGKLNHLGLNKAPAKSAAAGGLRNRESSFFEALYYKLIEQYKSFLSDSRTYGLTFKELPKMDSTTIILFGMISSLRSPKSFLVTGKQRTKKECTDSHKIFAHKRFKILSRAERSENFFNFS